jgi:hypothetical protein
MADETFDGVLLAVGVQAGFGAINGTVRDLDITTPLTSADGIVLGDREAGDAESGIVIPDFEPLRRELAAVSYTPNFATFVREAFNNLGITYHVKGNGVTSTPSAGQAKPLAGIDALNQSAGFVGANGASPIYVYTPRASAIYLTAKLWLADLSFCFQDCIVGRRSTVYTPGGYGIRTDEISIGAISATGTGDGVVFTSPTWGTQSSLAAPTVEGVANTWNAARGFTDALTITVENNIEDIGDSNVADTGIRKSQKAPRLITASGSIFAQTADSDFEYQQTKLAVAPTDLFTFQLGDVAGATDTINAQKIELENPQTDRIKYNRAGDVLVVEFDLSCRDSVAGSEYTETYN